LKDQKNKKIETMKKILTVLAIAIGLFFTSCEKEIGTVTVLNETGYDIWTDVTWGDGIENYEKHLDDGSSYKYNDVPAGTIEIWISFNNTEWAYEYENLSVDEDMLYTWYLSSMKSANGCPFVLDLGDGVRHVPVLKEKH
jgi:hypothetical protein